MAAAENMTQKDAMSAVVKIITALTAVVGPAAYMAYEHFPFELPRMPSKSDRLIFTLQCHILTACVILHMVQVPN